MATPEGTGELEMDGPPRNEETLRRLLPLLAALAAENARLSDEVRHQREELADVLRNTRTLNEIVSLVLASPDSRHAVELILERALAAGPFDMGVVHLIRGGQFELLAARGLIDVRHFSSYRREESGRPRSVMRHMMSSSDPLVVEYVPSFGGLRGFKLEHVKSVVIVPIRAGTEPIGVMGVGSRSPRRFSAATVELLATIGRQAGIALQKAQLYEETQQAEERYRVVSEMTSDFAYAVEIDDEGNTRTLWITSAVADVTGYTPEEVIAGGGGRVFVNPDDYHIRDERKRLLAEGRPSTVETRVITRAGETRWIRLITQPQWDEAKGRVVRYYAAAKDITEQKRAEEALAEAEEQLRQSQKMEAIGMLAGGIAHDFNNLLTVILGFSELLLAQPPTPESARPLEEIRRAGERAADLTAQLLAFSRRQVLQPKVLDLNAVVRDMETLLRRIIGEDVELVTRLDPRIGAIRADPSQLGQVIMNLATNARDAMPNGGQLIIETSEVDLSASSYGERHGSPRSGRSVLLAVSDTGVGMDAEVRKRLFEPFFTTRSQGKGTGLGLAMVYGIVKQSDGDIWVYSEPGMGTTFKIYLPVLEGAESGGRPGSSAPLSERGEETVLVVEDEPAVRALAVAVLADKGYTVLEASSGIEAIELCRRHAGPIDLVLTDLVMPGMSGRELAGQLATLRPEARVLYMSGYTDDVAVRHGLLDPSFAYLQKPFKPAALAGKVRELLDAKA